MEKTTKIINNMKKFWFRYLLISTLLSILGIFLREIYQYTIPIAKGTQLSITLQDGNTGKVSFKNIGKFTVEITKIEFDKYFSNCTFFTLPSIDNLEQYMKEQIKEAINKNSLLKVKEAEGLVLSSGENWTRQLLSKATTEGTLCAFDIPLKINYTSTSWWADKYLKFLKTIDLIDPKQYLYIRFDGCQFYQIGEAAYKNRSESEEEINDRLNECLKNYPKFYIKKTMIEKGDKQLALEIKTTLKTISNEKLINASNYLLRHIKNIKSGDKAGECYKFIFLYSEIQDRNLTTTSLSYEEILNSCINQ